MAVLLSGTTIGGYTAIHTNNISSYALTSVPSITQLLSPNGATVVGADQAMPSAGHSFIHTLALGPGNNDGHILGMTWAGTTSIYGAQIFIDTDPNDIMAIRSRSSTGVWTSWKTIIHSGTIGSQSVNYATSAGNSTTTSQRSFDYIYGTSYLESAGAVYGTIFYDNNDRSYYVDPNSTSVLNRVVTAGRLEVTYNADRYQMNLNRSSGSNWWITNDSDKLGLHLNNVGDKIYFATDGNIWSSYYNDWLSNIFNSKQNASTAITTSNIGSQSVNYANTAGSAGQVSGVSVSGTEMNRLKATLGATSLPYSCDIYVDGDANTYYPVHFIWGDQDVWRRIIIKRGYSEEAPWDPIGTGAHHGGLLLDWEGNFGGWGGAEYSDRLRVFNESYTNVCADMYIYTHSMGYVFMLRGGHALYHIFSDQEIRGFHQVGTPDIAYDTSTKFYDSSTDAYDVYAPAPVTTVNSSRIDGLRTKKQSLFDSRYLRQGVDISGIGTVTATNFLATNAFYLNGTSYYLNSTNGGIYTNARFEAAGNLHIGGSSQFNGNVTWFSGGSAIALENGGSFARFAFNRLDFYDWQHGVQMEIDSNYVYVNNYLQAGNSLRAPIFYDSNDTGYYVDPNGTSRLNAINYDNLYFAGDTTYGFIGRNVYADTVNGRGSDPLELNYYDGGPVKIGSGTYGSKDLYASMVYVSSGNAVIHAGNIASQSVSYADESGYSASSGSVEWTSVQNKPSLMPLSGIPSGSDQYVNFRVIRNSNAGSGSGMHIGYGNQNSGDTLLYGGGGTNAQLYVYGDHVYSPSSFRAPIFYDSNDTGYYGNFAGFSRLSEAGITNTYTYNYFNVDSSRAVNEFGHVGLFRSTQSATTDYIPFSFQSQYGNHSWGQVARFHIEQSGADRPSIQFSSGSSNTRWNIGYCNADDQFRITQNMGYRPDLSGTHDGWGTERVRIDTSGNVIVSQGLFGSDVYTNGGWFRNHSNNNGIYWSNTGWHLMPENSADFRIHSGNNSESALRMETNGTTRGYVYANSSNEIGFLNNGRSWRLRVYPGGAVESYGDFRAPIFYDSNDTNYYVDPNSTSRLYNLNIVGTLNTGNVINLGFNIDGSISTSSFRGINFHTFDDLNYYIGKPSGGWTQPLHIHFYTGIWLRSHQSYGGTRFYNLSSGSHLMSVGDGGDQVNVYGRLYMSTRTDIHQSGGGGGENRFDGLEGPSTANGRGQLVISSAYSDLVIASSQSNDNHGSTLTFASYNPSDRNDYRKFVINQGNWGARLGYLDFGFANVGGRTNPHSNINGSDTAFTIDGFNKRVGVANVTPGYTLDVNGIVNTPSGYISVGNPWGTANSAFFPNGITTAGGTNWIYGYTYIGNAPGNGAGHEFSASGTQYSTGSITTPLFLVNNHSDNTRGYRIHNTSGTSVSAMFTNSSNQLVIAAGALDQINLNKKVYVNGVALGVNVAPSATAGRIDASNDIVAYSSSDERLKTNITPIENALDKVKSLTGVEFDWKAEYTHAHGYEGHDTGVIAQQVQEVMPTAVRTNDTGFLAVRYEKLIGLLIEANKELAARVEELEKKLG